jgi:SagB-type dehydrogenase family enzyme
MAKGGCAVSKTWILLAAGIVVVGLVWMQCSFSQDEPKETEKKTVKLPKPKEKGEMSVEEAIKRRRCVRSYKDKAMSLEQLSQLLWSANGITGNKSYYRAAPSAGGLHPLDFYAVVGKDTVTGLDAGVWHYDPEKHRLTLLTEGDKREALKNAALGQKQIGTARVDIMVTIEFERTTKKYGERGKQRYAYMDCGFACENVFLQTQSLGLSMCVVGAFHDDKVAAALSLPEKHEPALLLTIGYPE